MIGIYGVISRNKLTKQINSCDFLTNHNQRTHILNSENYPNASLCKYSLKKFVDNKIFQRTGDRLVSIDGVILNFKSLLWRKQARNLYELILKLSQDQELEFPNELRGSFQGLIYFEDGNKLVLFVDHVGSRPLFYFFVKGETLVFGTELSVVARIMRQMGYETCLDENGAYCLLALGNMLGDLTLVRGVKRLTAGSVMRFENGEILTKQYYRISDKPNVEGSEHDILGELNKRFRRAVYLEYAMDLEYGYRHIAALSGGLDTRTNVGFATKLGFKDLTCFTLSQRNYLDDKIAGKICRDKGFKQEFFPLDGGDFLIEYMDEVIKLTGGLATYLGPGLWYPWLNELRLERFGFMHTGNMGGETLGELLPQKLASFLPTGSVSGRLLGRISHLRDNELSRYDSEEVFKLYFVLNSQVLTFHLIDQFIDSVSAHISPDLMDYSTRIPSEYRDKKQAYVKMINVYLPEFAKYTWEHKWVPPRYPLFFLKGYDQVLSLLRYVLSKLGPYYSMYPFDYWYKTNSRLKVGFERTFDKNIEVLESHPSLESDCTNLFRSGNFVEKANVITLLRAMKIFALD